VRTLTAFSLGFALLTAACSATSDRHEYTLQGQIISVAPDHKDATIKHENIKGFMPAMTMPYKVRDAKEYETLAPGDLINATLVVVSNEAYLKDVKKVGNAPLEKPPAEATMPAASSGFEPLKLGQPVPSGKFVNQDGKPITLDAFRGSAVLLTFIYTNCPMPTFCPLMDRQFAAIQKAVKEDATLRGRVHLVSVSFDPKTDTPPVLKAHAKTLDADPTIWTFLTGDRDVIDQFAARFGVSVARTTTDPRDLTHNLRTAIVGADGKLVKVYMGNEWTPEQIEADLKGRTSS
jgi:protein SCO1/2